MATLFESPTSINKETNKEIIKEINKKSSNQINQINNEDDDGNFVSVVPGDHV